MWTKNGKKNMKIVLRENWVLGLLISIEGIISNLSLLSFIIGIPLYFIFGI